MGFTRFTKNVLNVSALPDRVQNQAQTLKATFDQAGVDIKTALNALIAELEASTSADNIGADVQSVATKTVQAILTAFEEEIANRYTKVEAETLLAIGTNDLVADIDVNLTTGVITITKKDGTVETFDTAIEKVPAKFEIVQNGDAYALKITNVDGTSTQADITNFMNIYNFNNSDNITFEVTGTGTEKTVTANIKANSIGLDKLSLSVVSTLEGYMTSARDSANAAKASETNARASELNALEAKNTAIDKAEEAVASASAAKISENNAEYWAKQAEANGGGGGGITEIPVATTDTLGGIKVGEGLSITEDGVLSAEGGSGSSGTAIKTTLWEGNVSTASTNLDLSDSIENYSHITIEAGYGNYTLPLTHIDVTTIKANGYGTEKIYFLNGMVNSNAQIMICINVTAKKQIYINTLGKYGGVSGVTLEIRKVVGLKNVETLESNSLVKVLEASTDNVIDFNTLTESGYYLIKNCSLGGGTVINCDIEPSTDPIYYADMHLLVRESASTNITQPYIYQEYTRGNGATKKQRYYKSETATWSEWDILKTPAANVGFGEFGERVTANETAVADLTQPQVRNIKASATDLTAGTSVLKTGYIHLVYE
jgi:hypothetical protein